MGLSMSYNSSREMDIANPFGSGERTWKVFDSLQHTMFGRRQYDNMPEKLVRYAGFIGTTWFRELTVLVSRTNEGLEASSDSNTVAGYLIA